MFGIRAERNANSQLGYALSWVKKDNKIQLFNTEQEAQIEVEKIRTYMNNPNLKYWTEKYEN